MFLSGFAEGQHVVARRDLDGWLGPVGYPSVRRGTRGIVRGLPAGVFSDRYEVEFLHRGRVRVSGRHLRPALYGHGEEAWRRYKAHRAGVRLGMLVLTLPAIVAIIRYYLNGGSTAGLIAAVPGAAGDAVLRLIAGIVGLTGLPMLLVFIGAIWLWLRHRR